MSVKFELIQREEGSSNSEDVRVKVNYGTR